MDVFPLIGPEAERASSIVRLGFSVVGTIDHHCPTERGYLPSHFRSSRDIIKLFDVSLESLLVKLVSIRRRDREKTSVQRCDNAL